MLWIVNYAPLSRSRITHIYYLVIGVSLAHAWWEEASIY